MAIISNIRLFLALVVTTQGAHAGRTFVTSPGFAKGDISVNTDKCFADSPCHGDGRKVGEATITGNGMEKVFGSLGKGALAALLKNNAFKDGVTVPAQYLTQSSEAHSDHYASGDVMAEGERTGFIVMSGNNDAYFDHADGTSVPMEYGDLISFDGGVSHKTVVNSGRVLLAGPFDLATFKPVGNGVSCDAQEVTDPAGSGQVTFNRCSAQSGCDVCTREVTSRRRGLFENDKDEDCEETEFIQVCVCDDNECLNLEGTVQADSANGDILCTCGLPAGAACEDDGDCCSDLCVSDTCLACIPDGGDCNADVECCSFPAVICSTTCNPT